MVSWPRRTIGDLLKKVSKPVEVIADREYRQIGIRSHCKGIFHKPPSTGTTIGSKRVFWVEPGCFVVNIVFAWEQAIAMTSDAERGMVASHRFPMYRSSNGQLLPEYAHLYFSSPRGKYDLGIASPGGAGRNKTLGQDEFKRLKIPVPPIEHQQLTVDVGNSWSRAIAQITSLIEAKRGLQHGLMQQLLAGTLRLEKSPAKLKSGGLPEGWKFQVLGSLGTTYPGLAGKTKTDFGTGAPYISYLNIFKNSRIDPNMLERVKIAPGEKQHAVRRGDIFFTTSSETPEEVGMSSVLLHDIGLAYLNSFCFGFRLQSFDVLLPEYARHLFRGPRFRKDIYRLAQGATRYNLSKTKLMKTSVLLPPISEQERIIRVLDIAEADVVNLCAIRDQVEQQKNGLIQGMLMGRVPFKVKP